LGKERSFMRKRREREGARMGEGKGEAGMGFYNK